MARLLAIGDIHGCLPALKKLLAAVKLTTEDQLVTLGDYVHRGPDTPGVLDLLIDLHRENRVISLMGNHDELYLEAHDDGRKLSKKHRQFFQATCHNYFETNSHIFVHANVVPTIPMAEQSTYTLRWEKLYGPLGCKPHFSGKTIVCGHTAQKSGLVLNVGYLLCIDTFCYGGQWLTCADLTTQIIYQANLHGDVRRSPMPLISANPYQS
ncbi:MAG: metallophosphoesterase family protein [Zavarzinella sp.]